MVLFHCQHQKIILKVEWRVARSMTIDFRKNLIDIVYTYKELVMEELYQ